MSITLKQVADYQAAAQKQAAAMFEVAVSAFFKAVPQMQFVAFKVYAPAFNDGDACLPRFQSEVAYSFVSQETIDEEFDGIAYIDDMPFALKLDPWSYRSGITLQEVEEQFNRVMLEHEDDVTEDGEQRVDFSSVIPDQLQAILEFHEGIVGLGHDFFYNHGEDGLYVLSATGMDVLEVDIDY